MSGLPRRDFLKTGSVVAVGVALSGLLPDRLFAAAADGAVLSVGFAELPPAGQSARLGAAERVLAGDPAFISHGARVTVSSYHRATKYEGKPGGHALAAVFPVLGYEPAKYPRFNAWSYSARGATDDGRRAVRFNMPVTATQGVQFAVQQSTGGSETRLALTLSSSSDALKLQRGVYVIGLRESPSDAVPGWGSLSVRQGSDGFVVDTTAFSYIVVTVGYAG